MCGIVGYIGSKQAYPIIIKGLKRLEYRGYDSAGIAILNNQIKNFKKQGKVTELEKHVGDNDVTGTMGIGHTRWATHGEPNDVNAHPHYSNSGNLVMIHNGIIENYDVLKKELLKRGYTFQSDTDTEVLVNLIEEIQKQEKEQQKQELAKKYGRKYVDAMYELKIIVGMPEDLVNVIVNKMYTVGSTSSSSSGDYYRLDPRYGTGWVSVWIKNKKVTSVTYH